MPEPLPNARTLLDERRGSAGGASASRGRTLAADRQPAATWDERGASIPQDAEPRRRVASGAERGGSGPEERAAGLTAGDGEGRRHGKYVRVRIRASATGGGRAEPAASKYASLPAPYRGDLTQDDAIATILAWLYDRIPKKDLE